MASNDTPKTVELYGVGIQHEALCTDAAITPGMLVTRTATGVRPHNVAGAAASPAFACENGMIGRGITDTYATGDQVTYKTYAAGSGIYAILAASQTIAVGAYLASNGAGALRAAAAEENIVAQAVEAVTTTGAVARIRVEVVSGYVSAA